MKTEDRGGNDGSVETMENQAAVSHGSHRPLEIAHRTISTFPPRRLLSPLSNCKQPNVLAPAALAPLQERSNITAAKNPSKLSRSGSSRVGMKLPFQAHSALESKLMFRLILGLENATH
jgi:hypothetical protein